MIRLLTAALIAAPGLRAEDNLMKPAAAPAAVVHFVEAKRLDLAQILPKPPAAGSLAAQADLETVRQVQAARTAEQVAWAKIVDKNDVFAVFGAGGLLPASFKAENFPRFVQLLKDINDDLRPLIDQSKKAYARPRPYALDPRVQPCVDLPTNDSYPSGHSYNGWMRAAVLAEIFPEMRAELMDRARYFCWGRVLAGVHFPTDLEGGKRIALAGFAELMKSAAFRARIEECRAEAAAARRKKAA
ncbi:MAG: phosphatase PAP2 family protein [Verrucomicrobia bacterium]|nr:phosphatase PAP2 family protein [Verrucomicrobiota bacterium]